MKRDVPIAAVRNVIASQLRNGSPRLTLVAGELGISRRSLQRHLANKGQTYKSLVDALRTERACQRLHSPGVSMSRIAAELGYTETPHFSRAFARWTGMSPSQYRSSLAAEDPEEEGVAAKKRVPKSTDSAA